MNIILFGGSGGLGSKLSAFLEKKHQVTSLSSKNINITDSEAVNNFFSTTDADVVINFAGINIDGLIHKQSPEDVKKQLDVNISGLMNIMRGCIPKMRDKKFGRIICISSVLALRPIKGTSTYSGTKAFIDNLVRTCALENAKYGITCNSIQSGYFDGGLAYKVPENVLKSVIERVPLNRLGKIEELNNCIEFIINTEFLTGSNIDLSGGLSIN